MSGLTNPSLGTCRSLAFLRTTGRAFVVYGNARYDRPTLSPRSPPSLTIPCLSRRTGHPLNTRIRIVLTRTLDGHGGRKL
jgi:hypothetical protein